MTRDGSITPPKPELDAVDFRVTKAKVRAALLGRASTPIRIGRFEVVGRAGEGAMGRVMIGHDPELGRKVALKLIAVRAHDPEATERLRRRLVREARALASLSHPNVVIAYDVGLSAGDVYVAMEYVEGQTLREWSLQPRSWQEVVDVFVQAGRGLAAAHARGFVHRDFKPDNVLVGTSGRVRVADFGLARGPQAEDDESTEERPPSKSHLTQTGARLGTPAYRAPEVEARRPAEPASDQYSYCVALHEVLHGHRPGAEPMRRVPERRDHPRWIDRVVERGLRLDPHERYPSMEVLLADLQRPREARRRRIAVFAVLVALGGALSLSSMNGLEGSPCLDLHDELAGIWDHEARAQLQERFAGESREYGRALGERVLPLIDEHARQWIDQRIEACESARVRNEQRDATLVARVACLYEQRAELEATVRALGTEEALENAPTLVHELPSPEACGSVSTSTGKGPVPEEIGDEVESIRAALARVRVLERAGELQQAREAAAELLAPAEATGYEPLIAEVGSRFGRILGRLDDHAAERTLEDAVWRAESLHHDALAADTWMHLVSWAEHRESEPAQMEALLDRASAAVTRLGEAPERKARLHTLAGRVAIASARYDDARAELERAIEIKRRLDPQGPSLANAIDALGALYYRKGDYEGAQRSFEQAAAIYEKVYGPEHPKVARTIQNAATALVAQQGHDAALPRLLRVRGILERAYGPEHTVLISLENTLGATYEGSGRWEEAVHHYERALSIAESNRGSEHASLISPLTNLGRILPRLDRAAEARARLERAVAIAQGVFGEDHPKLAEPLTSLGRLLLDEGEVAAAIALHERALAIRKASVGADSLVTATSEHNLGDALSRAERHEEALEHLNAAQRIFGEHLPPEHLHHGLNHLVRARVLTDAGRAKDGLEAAQAASEGLLRAQSSLRAAAKFELARARAASGGGLGEARRMAEDALRMLETEVGTEADALRERIEAWLR